MVVIIIIDIRNKKKRDIKYISKELPIRTSSSGLSRPRPTESHVRGHEIIRWSREDVLFDRLPNLFVHAVGVL